MTSSDIRKQIIGASGEAFVTYKLLKHSVDSARMTTDAGVDVLMYVPGSREAATIQVKAQWEPVPAGGKSELAYGWTFDHDSPADYLAVVDLSRDLAWLFTIDEARHWAQQHHSSGKRRLYWYPDDAAVKSTSRREADMQDFQIDTAIERILQKNKAGETAKPAKTCTAQKN